MFKPIHTFFFLSASLLILLIVSIVFRDKNIHIIENFNLKVFNIKNIFEQNNILNIDSVERIIKNADIVEKEIDSIQNTKKEIIKADTLKIYQTLQAIQIEKNFISKIEYPNEGKNILKPFVNALKNAREKSTHILYYGDSQIEEDRFSGFIRSKLQAIYGGSGCGLLPIMPVAQWMYPKIQYSESWYKWDCFADAPKPDEYYGIMGQTFLIDFDKGAGKVKIKCNSTAMPSNCVFNKVVVYYGFAKELCKIKFFNNQELISQQILDESPGFSKKIFAVKNNEEVAIEIEGFESPYFYGISLESFNNGVYVDNIALRGSSGTFFHLIDKKLLKSFFDDLNVSLIILQFGGNVMPMIDSEEKAKQYGNYIYYQLKIIKSIHPNVPVLFVGPADMSVNTDGIMQTHPYLEKTIEYLRDAVLKSRCAFFDMYKAMGGKNSMPVWVEENLAAKDYIHFSPVGAKKMASLIYYSLIKDMEEINL